MNRTIKTIPATVFMLVAATGSAQENIPDVITPDPANPTYICRISDNGKYGVIEKPSETEGTIVPSGGYIIDLETLERTDISHSSRLNGVSDISNDGAVVVGEVSGSPAFWTPAGGWTVLPLPPGMASGRLSAVTPDGRYATGYTSPGDNIYDRYPVVYDLTDKTFNTLSKAPKIDISGEIQKQASPVDISPDGKHVLVRMSHSYVLPPATCNYIYNVDDDTYDMIGYTELADGNWRSDVANVVMFDEPVMSHNGKWVAGSVLTAVYVDGQEFPVETTSPFRYNIETKELEIYSSQTDAMSCSIMNDGTVLATTPASNPYSYALVNRGDYFIEFDQIFKQVYGLDFNSKTGFSNTGKPIGVSEDGKTIILMTSTTDNFILRLKEPLLDAAAKVDLLAGYTCDPASGTIMSKLGSVTLQFDREVETNGIYSRISLKSEDGENSYTPLSNGGFTASGRTVRVSFRTVTLRDGVKYTLTIPSGMIRIKGDRNTTNKDIELTYIGRKDGPIELVSSYPADNASVGAIDLTENPVLLTFDCDVKLASGAKGYVYREEEDEPFVELTLLASDRRVLAYPVSKQYLYKGTTYSLVIPAGSVTDVSGSTNSGNSEISLTYRGAYERQISADDKYIFRDNSDSYDNFMFYDGDRLDPASTPAGWGFSAQVPWYIVRSSTEKTDMAFAAHSMYSPAGKADDWMMTPQLFIPDADCYLAFDAQSYLNSKTDRLKVYLYESDKVYNTLTKNIVDDIRANGKVIFDEPLTPGASEEGLEDDWTNYKVMLGEYAGKEIYIAFANENEDQSAVFLDNVQVVHDMRYLISLENESRVVAKDDIVIRGSIAIASDIETYGEVAVTLKDSDGEAVDRIEETGLNLKKGDVYRFVFGKALPLESGVVNPYTVEVEIDGMKTVLPGEIRNLAFQPVKRIVLEEFSGMTCSNCPLGFVAAENLHKIYGDRFISVILRTYGGDPLGTGVGNYSGFLGMSAAPAGRLNRGEIASPMVSVYGDYMLSGEGYSDSSTGEPIQTWLDIARKEMEIPSEMDFTVSNRYTETDGKIAVSLSVRNALDLKDAAVNVFTVITEDGIETAQLNGFASVDDPDLGEFGQSGKYGGISQIYPFIINDVARGAFGTTFNGTGALIPSDLESGREYPVEYTVSLPGTVADAENCNVVVMLIDAATGRVINVNKAPINGDSNGIAATIAGTDTLRAAVDGNRVTVTGEGVITARAIDMSGKVVAAATGDGHVVLDLDGKTGVMAITAFDGEGNTLAAKILVR